MSDIKFEDFTDVVNKLYIDKNYDKIPSLMKKLESNLTDYCKKMNGVELQKSFYEKLLFIVEDINRKNSENYSDTFCQDFELAKNVLICVRNSFYKSSLNQKMVGENEEFLTPLVTFLKNLLTCLYKKEDDIECSHLSETDGNTCVKEEQRKLVLSTSSVCVTLFVNMMAGNSSLRKRLWPFLRPFMLSIISYPERDINHVGAALLHQFLIEDELKKNIYSADMRVDLYSSLLKAYLEIGPNSCFSLYCLEIMIESEGLVTDVWDSIKLEESLLILDILITFLQKGKSITPDTVLFLKDKFKSEADEIFRTFSEGKNQLNPIVTIRIASFLCYAASSDCSRDGLQKDKSLLISSVYLLRGITEIGDVANNFFSRVNDIDAKEDLLNHPAFGFKSDLIRLIAALVYRNKENQDIVRDIDGIHLILENSQYDARNPLIKESSIFAIRNLLENNPENQKIIWELQLRGTAENESLSRLGLEISIENNKVSLHQK